MALKVQKSASHYTESAMDEITILKQIFAGDPENKKGVVKLRDHFKHSGPHGTHVCMVFEYLGDNLLTLIKRYDYRGLPLPMVKEIAKNILIGLDYLHRELSIIHTDLKPENVMLVKPADWAVDQRKQKQKVNDSYESEVVPGVPVEEKTKVSEAPSGEMSEGSLSHSQGLSGVSPGGESTLTKNQKKKMKRKAKKAGNLASVSQEETLEERAEEENGEEEFEEAEGLSREKQDSEMSTEAPRNRVNGNSFSEEAKEEVAGREKGGGINGGNSLPEEDESGGPPAWMNERSVSIKENSMARRGSSMTDLAHLERPDSPVREIGTPLEEISEGEAKGEVNLDCKIVDLGNACWTYKQVRSLSVKLWNLTFFGALLD